MQRKKYTGYIVGAILVLLGVFVSITFNSLVNKEEIVIKQWSEVQNTYQRRLDLVPSLVNVVKGVSGFEQSTLQEITEARANALKVVSAPDVSANNYQNQEQLQNSVAASANRVILIIEKYPTLKGTAAYSGLQTQLDGTERRIKVARKDFNKAVADYNKKVRTFPSNIIASLFGFKKKEGFEADAGNDKVIEIKFN